MAAATTYRFGLSEDMRGQQIVMTVLVIVSAIITVNMVLDEDG
jgi:hypothetical protein